MDCRIRHVWKSAMKKGIGKSKTSIKIRIDFDDGRHIGHGRIQLLELIGEHGSIMQAAKAMGMSYKRAWYLMDEFGAMFAERLIQRRHGGPGGGSATLTPFGSKLVTAYREMERATFDLCVGRLKPFEKLLVPQKATKMLVGQNSQKKYRSIP
jgi:molybdate transport system regulatory protein